MKLTDKDKKAIEKIAKDLPDDEFKDRYGDDWKSVKIATATKIYKKKDRTVSEDFKSLLDQVNDHINSDPRLEEAAQKNWQVTATKAAISKFLGEEPVNKPLNEEYRYDVDDLVELQFQIRNIFATADDYGLHDDPYDVIAQELNDALMNVINNSPKSKRSLNMRELDKVRNKYEHLGTYGPKASGLIASIINYVHKSNKRI